MKSKGSTGFNASYLRVNYWYINIYVLWLNTTLNIIVPIVSLVILNINTSR